MPTPELPAQGDEADAGTGGVERDELEAAWGISHRLFSSDKEVAAKVLELIKIGEAGTE